MKLNELFSIVSEGQDVRLINDDFGEINGTAAGIECALSKEYAEMCVIGVEAEYDGVLKVWVGEICKVI